MFNSIWRRFTQCRSRRTPIQRRPDRTLLRVEMLEDRVTPSLTASISTTGILTVTSSNPSDSLTVTSLGSQQFSITDNSGFTFTGGSGTFSNTAAQPINAMVFNLNGGGANTSLNLAGTPSAPINLMGLATPTTGTDLTISATGTNAITATNLNLLGSTAGLSMTLGGVATTSFTDTNITGSAIINHTGAGNTNFNVNTSAANPTALNTWGSLAITNGTGSDSQIITDTDFTDNVTINNGAGSGTGGVIYPNEGGPVVSSPSDGGSQTWIYGINNQHLLTIGGNLTVTTATGQSDTEINNYNVIGAFTVNGGAGIAGQQNGSIVAINNCPVFPGGPSVAGLPVFGSINITDGSVLTGTGVNAGLNVFLGTGVGTELGVAGPIPVNDTPPVFLAPDYPFIVNGNLSVSATGTGSVNMYLDGLTVHGAATLTTSATNNNGVNIVVLGDQAATSFGSLSVNVLSNAAGVHAAANNVYLQAQQGTMNVTGALNVHLGSGNDTVMVGSAGSGNVSVGGIFGLTGTGGNKTITVFGNVGNPGNTNNQTFGGLNWNLNGTGTESASLTDTNIPGSAIVNHTGTGNTNFDVQTSAANSTALNTWGSLSITNGTGADAQIITDTDFTGNVTIHNGAGGGTGGVIYPNEGQDGGSQTWIYGINNQHLLTIGGNLTVDTATGQSDTEINNTNVLGAFTVNGGAGIAGQSFGNIVAINNCPSGFLPGPAVAGVPVFGSINITDGSVLTGTGVNAGLNVLLGTGVGSELGVAEPIPTNDTPPVFLAPDYPFIVNGNLSVSATGTGSVNMYLDGLTVHGAATLTTSATNNNGVNLVVLGDQATTSFGSLSVNVLSNPTANAATNNVYLQAQQGTMNVAGALNVNLGAAAGTLTIGSANSSVNVTGTFTLTAKPTNSNAVSISALDDTFGALNWRLSGKGTETALFTDTSVTGAATINTSAFTGAAGTTGVGASPTTTFTINTSAANTATFNTWGSLSITNGTGSDINSITDTNFKGNVTIANGAGATGDSSQFGGSDNIMSADHDNNLLSIMGNLSITTTTGQSDTEVYDYNVHGNVTLGAGTGTTNQTNANVIGLEDNQTNSGTTPDIHGNVTITGSALPTANLTYGLLVALGTNVNVNQNLIAYTNSYPLVIQGNLAITIAGSGSPDINLNDLTVATGSTTITLATEVNSLVQVQGTDFVSVYNTFTISSRSTVSGVGNDIYSLQDTTGTLEFNGAVKVTVGFTGNILDLAADAVDRAGVPGAMLDLLGTSSFTAGAGTNTHYAGARHQPILPHRAQVPAHLSRFFR